MYYNTQTFRYKSKVLCSYCGEEAKNQWEWHNHRPEEQYFNCDCEDALKEKEFLEKSAEIRAEAERKVRELKQELLSQVNQEMINTLLFEEEWKNLKIKYGME